MAGNVITADPKNQADQGDNRIPLKPEPPQLDSAAQSRAARAQLDTNRADDAHQVPLIGPWLPRYDGRQKVTGQAQYADDMLVASAAFACIVPSPVARGRIRSVDTARACAVSGVLRVYTHEAMIGRIKPARFVGQGGQAITDLAVMCGPEIAHAGQIIGLVVAESFEAAQEAAYLVRYEIDEQTPATTFGDPGLRTRPVAEIDPNWRDPAVGDMAAAFAQAAFLIEAEYGTPTHHHNPIELFSTTCRWEQDRLVVHEPSAGVNVLRIGLADQLGLPRDGVEVVSPFVGGSFGSKVNMTPRTALIALAARDLGRPVRCVLTRAQGFTQSTYRGETRHKLCLACDAGGKLLAYGHKAWELTSRTDIYTTRGTRNSVHLYAWPNADTVVHAVEADRATPGFTRAPAETPYVFALECAMDELAEKAGIDPVRLRIINDVEVSAYKGKRYTSRSLNQCLEQAAEAFGWAERDPRPGSMREGDWLIGYGVATACLPTNFSVTGVRVRITSEGVGEVQIGAHDIGTGAYGAAAIVAAQELGLPPDRVRVELGDSRLPMGPIAGSSRITASMCNAVAEACHRLRVKLGVVDGESIITVLKGKGAAEQHLDWTYPGAPPSAVEAFYQGGQEPAGGSALDKLRFAFGAEFVEVRVNRRTREIRVPRIVGAFAAGRIINANTARSQLLGGMIWGIGTALHEATEMDRRVARYVNDSIGEYLVPVNADIQSVEVIMIPEEDRDTNALGIKGIGELGNVGTAAAVCNAVYHATCKRIRELPVTIDKLL